MPTVAPYDFAEHVELATFIDNQPVFALADGSVHFPLSSNKTIEAHDGLLCATLEQNRKFILTGGEDGRVMRISDGASELIATQERKWIDVIASGPNGAVGFASGRTAWVVANGETKQFDHERAVEGLAFAPKGLRLACGRYNGVTLHWVAGSGAPVDLHWDGAHTKVMYSPDGKYIVTSMVENALHGWRLDDKISGDGKHMRMAGYPAKPKSLSWSVKGKWLASSGAPSAVCWPFFGKDGPIGKAPKQLGTRENSMTVCVACHPTEDVVAVGYADGVIMVVRIEDGDGAQLRPQGKGPISSLAWDAEGICIAFGSEEGEAGLIDVTG